MTRKLRLILLWLACGLLLSSAALAQRVLLVTPPATDPALYEAFGRLRAEVELQRFEVEVLPNAGEALSPDVLEAEAQARGAFAAISLERSKSGTTADIRIVDRVTGKTTTRRLSIESTGDGPTLLAIRAVDLLRVSLLELSPGERPPADVVGVEAAPPAPEVVQFAAHERRFQVQLGGLSLVSPTLGASLGVTASLRARPVPRMTVGASLGGTLEHGEFRTASGAATVRQELLLAHVSWSFGEPVPGARWEWGPEVAVGAVHVEATGQVEQPLVSRTDQGWSAAAALGMKAERFFNDTLSVAGQVSALGLFPQPVIAVDEKESSPLALQALATLSFGVSF